MINTVVNVNFVTGIKKIFPSPLKNVFLVLNVNGDLSLYRQDNEVNHIWSIGRFKGLVEVHWAPDCKLLAVQCLKRCFIYNSENGKSLSDLAIENENDTTLESGTICRWLTINEEDKTLLLLGLINRKTFSIKWSVNGEFELSGKFILKSDQIILDVKIDQVTNEILVLQSANNNLCSLTRLKFPFNNSKTKIHDSSNSISSLSKLSRHLQTLFRVTEDLKEQFLKLIKLEDSIFKRISEINSCLMKKLLLFGLKQRFDGFCNKENGDKLSENEFLEWKAKLKKHHNELLLQIQEFSNVLQTFHSNFPSFSLSTIDRFIKIFIPNLEQHSQTIQNTLAEFLIWLEIIVIESNESNESNPNPSGTNAPSSVNKIIPPLTPDASALELVKTLNKSETIKQERIQEWKFPFDEFKIKLDQEFKDLVNEINSINLVSESETLLPPNLNLILASSRHPFNFAFILKTCITEIICTSHPDSTIKLPGVYLGHCHFEQSNQLRIFCTGNAQLILTLFTEEFGNGELRPILNNQIDDSFLLFLNSSLNQLYITSTGTKLSITTPL